MKFQDENVDSVGAVLQTLQRQYNPPADIVWFRGHAKASWSLTPTLYRTPYKLEHEPTLLTRFMQNALPLLNYRPKDSWEWMFLLQHHGCPTRLLDWTESPLVALYFTCSNTLHDADDGHLWCLLPTVYNVQWGMAGVHGADIPAFGVGPHLEEWSAEKVNAVPGIKKQPAAAIAPRESGRMTVQQSVFTIHHVKTDPLESFGDQLHCWRLVIPAGAKPTIRKELATLGVSRLSIFSDLNSVGLLAKEAIA